MADDDDDDAFEYLVGRVGTLCVNDPRYRWKHAIYCRYDHDRKRKVVWVIPSGDEITVRETGFQPLATWPPERVVRPDWASDAAQKDAPWKPRGGDGGGSGSTSAAGAGADGGDGGECSICLDAPANKVQLPCGHVFCATCIMQLRQSDLRDSSASFGTGTRDTTCPNCRKSVPILRAECWAFADVLHNRFLSALVCDGPPCTFQALHGRRCIAGLSKASREHLEHVHRTAKAGEHGSSLTDYLMHLQSVFKHTMRISQKPAFIQPGAETHRLNSRSVPRCPSADSRRRHAVCSCITELRKLQLEWGACNELLVLSGCFDEKIDALHLEAFGSPYNHAAVVAGRKGSHGGVLDSAKAQLEVDGNGEPVDQAAGSADYVKKMMAADKIMDVGVSKLIVDDMDSAWTYVSSFGRHYETVLEMWARFLVTEARHFEDNPGDNRDQLENEGAFGARILMSKNVFEWIKARFDNMQNDLTVGKAYDAVEMVKLLTLVTILAQCTGHQGAGE